MTTRFTPLFFDGPHGPLYGVHHAPAPASERGHGILFLPPLGQEYKRCHKTLQKLATDLATVGFHVLRFDYTGSGDSFAGNMTEGATWDLESWQADGRAALRQLATLSGADRFSALGVRLGAAVATQLQTPLANLLLWDPVGNGPAYLEELDTLNRELLRKFRPARRIRRDAGASPGEWVGHPFPETMRDSLKQYSLTADVNPRPQRALWIETCDTPASARYPGEDRRIATEVRHCPVEARCHWRSLAEISNLIMGQAVSRQVLQHMKAEG